MKDKMNLHNMPVVKMPVVKMPVVKMPVVKMPVDRMPVDKMTCCLRKLKVFSFNSVVRRNKLTTKEVLLNRMAHYTCPPCTN